MRSVEVFVEGKGVFAQVDEEERDMVAGPAAAVVADQDVGNGRCVSIEIDRFC